LADSPIMNIKILIESFKHLNCQRVRVDIQKFKIDIQIRFDDY
jgi:hypothetical protein